MELQGKVIAETQERTGTSARGDWKAKDFVIETHETYPKKMVFSVFGEERLSRFNIQIGQEVLVSFDIDAREYNGRWFNSIRAYDVRQGCCGSVYSLPHDPRFYHRVPCVGGILEKECANLLQDFFQGSPAHRLHFFILQMQ